MISRREVLKDLEHVEKLVFLYKEWNISGPYCLAENCAVRYLKRSEMWNVLISGASTHSAIFSRSPFRIRTIPAQNIMSYHRKINNRQTCTCPAPYLNSGYQFRMPYDTLGEPYRTLQPVPSPPKSATSMSTPTPHWKHSWRRTLISIFTILILLLRRIRDIEMNMSRRSRVNTRYRGTLTRIDGKGWSLTLSLWL